eukprot:9483131-Pyramimonas_sp.AAC.1
METFTDMVNNRTWDIETIDGVNGTLRTGHAEWNKKLLELKQRMPKKLGDDEAAQGINAEAGKDEVSEKTLEAPKRDGSRTKAATHDARKGKSKSKETGASKSVNKVKEAAAAADKPKTQGKGKKDAQGKGKGKKDTQGKGNGKEDT